MSEQRTVTDGLFGLSIFSLAIIFAVAGQFLAYGVLNLVGGPLHLARIDPAHSTPTLVLGLMLCAQTILMAAALAKTGLTPMRIAIGIGAVFFALGVLLILWVALQCELYSECL